MKRTYGASLIAWLVIATWSLSKPGPAVPGDSTAKGMSLYKEHCMVCHGPKGKGDGYLRLNPPPADLSGSSVIKKSDGELMRTIHEGRPNTAMGAWKWVLSEAETRDVVAYVRTLDR